MPVSPHVLRKLQDVLGADAADYLVHRMEGTDALRADISELRHEMQLGFARIDVRFQQVDGRFDQSRSEWRSQLDVAQARMEALTEKGLREQARFFFLAWAVILATIVGLYAR